MPKTTTTTHLPRKGNIKARLVRITGHAGNPYWGIVASARYTWNGSPACDVVIARPVGTSGPERMVAYDRYIKPACLLDLTEPALFNLLDKLRASGTITYRDRQAFLRQRRELLKPTTYKRKNVTKCHDRIGYGDGPPPVSNALGKNKISHDWRKETGTWG